MTRILSGRIIRDSLIPKLAERARGLSRPPTLAIVQVGDRPDSTAYIHAKKSFAAKIGVTVKHIHVPENVVQVALIHIIGVCNADVAIQGIIIQLPLPDGFDRDVVLDAIDPAKDADGLTSDNVAAWSAGDPKAILPATARGVRELLEYYDIDIARKKVTVVGRSLLVGKPIAAMCKRKGADVTVCHSGTKDLARDTSGADVLIVAVGKPALIGRTHVREGQIVIDVGINTVQGKKHNEEIVETALVGDVDRHAVEGVISAITPVPGGVGPMTVAALFENVLDICEASC